MTPLPLHLPGCFLKSSLPQTYTKASLGLSTKASVASITGELLPPAGPTCLTGPPPTPIGLPLSSHLCKYKPAEKESLGLKDVPDLLPKHEPPPHPADTAAHARKRSRRLSKNFGSCGNKRTLYQMPYLLLCFGEEKLHMESVVYAETRATSLEKFSAPNRTCALCV